MKIRNVLPEIRHVVRTVRACVWNSGFSNPVEETQRAATRNDDVRIRSRNSNRVILLKKGESCSGSTADSGHKAWATFSFSCWPTCLQSTATFPKLSEHCQCFLESYIYSNIYRLTIFHLSNKAFHKLLCIRCICKQRIQTFGFNLVELRSIFFGTKSITEIRSRMQLQRFSLNGNRDKRPRW